MKNHLIKTLLANGNLKVVLGFKGAFSIDNDNDKATNPVF